MENIIALAGALGGIELLKWWFTRRQTRRLADVRADTEEFHALKEYNEFLQSQLMAKEERFAEQTAIVRDLNKEVIDLTRESGDLRIELQRKRCEVIECTGRRPPLRTTGHA